jgi:hypothetical protein
MDIVDTEKMIQTGTELIEKEALVAIDRDCLFSGYPFRKGFNPTVNYSVIYRKDRVDIIRSIFYRWFDRR